MALPEVAPLLAKDFVELKLDVERNPGAMEILQRYTAKKPGYPWILFLDSEGKALADGFDPQGANIGCPYEDKEIAHFVSMLDKARVNLTPADLDTLRKSLVEERGKIERAARAMVSSEFGEFSGLGAVERLAKAWTCGHGGLLALMLPPRRRIGKSISQ